TCGRRSSSVSKLAIGLPRWSKSRSRPDHARASNRVGEGMPPRLFLPHHPRVRSHARARRTAAENGRHCALGTPRREAVGIHMLQRPAHPRPSAASLDKARLLLDRALGGSKVIAGREACEAYAGDESDQEPVAPDVVVLAESPDDIAKALAAA